MTSFLQSRTQTAADGIGKPVLRKEDRRLVTGHGAYSDDFSLPGQAYACFVRSPHAHARIRRIETADALKVPGVIAVLTGADAVADGLKAIPHPAVPTNPHELRLENRDGSPIFLAPHPPLPADAARLVGEAVAMVVAETRAAAADGAAAVSVDYERRPAVTATVDAMADDAPRVWSEAPSNVCVDCEAGDAAATEAAFRRAAHVVRLETVVNRVTGVPMEPRAALGAYDEASGRYTLYAGSGGSVRIKNDLAATLGVPASAVRVVAREVGGNYGTRNAFYPEFALVPWAARRLGRPVKWTCEDLRGPLAGIGDETMSVPSYPYGCAVCEVEVDPETGVVEIVRYTTVDDVGRAVNPMILHGQTHGGIAAGVGQALWELCHYDRETGQLQSATFMDYALPRADSLPAFRTEISEVPSTSNPLGLRGGGEGGTTPALGAVVNAIVDALAELGVEHVEMPAAPERVWRAIEDAKTRG